MKKIFITAGISIPFKFSKKRKGDIAISFCNPKKALKELNWNTKYGLDKAMYDIKKLFNIRIKNKSNINHVN